jgi:hypothetical protein
MLKLTSNIKDSTSFFIENKYIRTFPSHFYLDFERIHLENSFYIVRLYKNKNSVQHEWKFKKKKNKEYYIYQVIQKKPIYLFITDDILVGDEYNKSIFKIDEIKK